MKIIRIIMDCCGASEDAIRSAQDLAVLGIDSLMSLELLPMFQQSFPGQNIELSMLERCKSLRDLEMALGSASIVSSLGSSSHRSSGDDERTPICTDKCDDNASGRIRGVIASVCDINQAEIVPHKSLDSLGVDSLLSIELHRALSQALNLELSPDDVSHSQTVDDLESLASRSVQQVTEPVNSANRSNPGPRARKETGLTTIQTDGSFQNFIEEHCYQACFISVGDLLRGRSTCCGPIQGSSNVAIVLHILPNAAVSQSCVTIVP